MGLWRVVRLACGGNHSRLKGKTGAVARKGPKVPKRVATHQHVWRRRWVATALTVGKVIPPDACRHHQRKTQGCRPEENYDPKTRHDRRLEAAVVTSSEAAIPHALAVMKGLRPWGRGGVLLGQCSGRDESRRCSLRTSPSTGRSDLHSGRLRTGREMLEVVCEAQCEGNQGEGWVRVTAGGEH